MGMLWEDRKRHLGLPLSFTKYSLSESRLHREVGLLSSREEDILLYRINDISLTRTLWQKICRVGTITLHSSDKSAPTIQLVNIANPRDVKEMLFKQVEDIKLKRRVRPMELVGDTVSDVENLEDIDEQKGVL